MLDHDQNLQFAQISLVKRPFNAPGNIRLPSGTINRSVNPNENIE